MNKMRFFSPLIVVLFSLGTGIAGTEVKIAEVHGAPGAFDASTAIAFNAENTIGYATNPGSGELVKFSLASGRIVDSLLLAPGIGPLGLSPNGQRLLVLGVANQTVYIVDAGASNGKMTKRFEKTYLVKGGNPSGFTARSNVLMSFDNYYGLFSDPSAGDIIVFNLTDGSLHRQISLAGVLVSGINPNYMTIVPQRKTFEAAVVCSGFEPGDAVGIWLVDHYQVDGFRYIEEGYAPAPFNNIAGTPSNSVLLAPSFGNNRLIRYERNTGAISSIDCRGIGPAKVAVSPDGRYAAAVNVTSQTITLFSIPGVNFWHEVSIPDLGLNNDTLPAFSRDGSTLYIPAGSGSELVAWDVVNSTILRRIPVGQGPLSCQVSGDGSLLTSVDVAGNDVSLIASNPIPSYLPHLIQDGRNYSGIAVANFGTEAAALALLARDDSGALIPGSANPRYLQIRPGEQIPLIAGQIFGFDPEAMLSGYLDTYTLSQDVRTLYLTGAIDQTNLGGFLADGTLGKRLGFSRITEGVIKFGAETSSEIMLENPGDTAADVILSLHGNTPSGIGSLVAYKEMTLPAHSRIYKRISQLLPSFYFPSDNLYLEVNSNVPLKGMEKVTIGKSFAMIPAADRTAPDTDFFAVQFASGRAGSEPGSQVFFSSLALANSLSTGPITVTATVVDDKGKAVPPGARPSVWTLQPYESISGTASELLGFPDPLDSTTLYQGSLHITADKPGLIANLIYGDALAASFLTAAGLHAESGRNFAFAHVAEGRFGEPAKGYYTGIAFYNPSSINTASITVQVNKPDGEYLNSNILRLQPGGRLSQTIGQIIPGLTQVGGGTVLITSSVPIIVFEVFGSTESEFLVAVPPVKLD